MSEEKFGVLSHIDHVLTRPSTYVGSTRTCLLDDWVWNDHERKMEYKKNVKYNEALVKIISEVIDNAVDNSLRTDGYECTSQIKVQVDHATNRITVINDGTGIPVIRKDLGDGNAEMYIPTTVFGVPMSGSNFNEDREGTIGMNGLGVKLCNILSKEFTITCVDKERGLRLRQTWKNNMREREPPKVNAFKRTSGTLWSTCVSFVPDLSFFEACRDSDSDCNITNILDDLGPVIQTRLLQVSVAHPNAIKIYFNGKAIKCKGLKAYMKLFTSEKTFYDSVPEAHFEYGLTLSPSKSFEHQSFVNCQRTISEKSTHTRYVTSKIASVISEHLKKKGLTVKLSLPQITNNLFVFVNIRVKNPNFTSQTKVELSSSIDPRLYPIDTKRVLGLIKKTGLLEKLENELSTKALNVAQKKLNASTKRAQINIPKLDDAHDAGSKKNNLDTTLFLVEGDSAKTMVTTGMSIIGRKKYGVFPLRGKLLNVIGATPSKLADNKEIGSLMEIIGLNFNRKYDTEQERQTLRYGRVCILCDADVDGMHITGLLLVFISHFWPSLVNSDFLFRFVTPIIKATAPKSDPKFFFTIHDYDKFVDSEGPKRMKKWNVHHLKGLGTSLRADTISYFKKMEQQHLKSFKGDQETLRLINFIFNPKESNWRKEWLLKPMEESRLNYNNPVMNISKFLRTEMYDFSSYSIKRAIAFAGDGLKVCQRKVLHASLLHFKQNQSNVMKVAQLASYTAKETNYGHGEVSLQGAIINMAQSFAGANNLPLLTEEGNFGSRIGNGSDAAAARYIFTKLQPSLTRLIFDETREEVLSYINEENTQVEPKFYVPSLPMVLINGTIGISTGFRALVPCFNPLDIVEMILAKLGKSESVLKPLIPWYGGTYRTNHKTVDDIIGKRWVFKGEINRDSSSEALIISELPIGVSFEDYKQNTLTKLQEKGIIKKFEVHHKSENEPLFKVFGYVSPSAPEEELLDAFQLKQSMTKNCLNLLDEKGVVRNFKTPEEIFDFWWNLRLRFLQLGKDCTIKHNTLVINKLSEKMRFIKAVVEGTLEIRNQPNKIIIENMKKPPITICDTETQHTLLDMPVRSLTQERFYSLQDELQTRKENLVEYKRLSIEDIAFSSIMELETILSQKQQQRNPKRPGWKTEESFRRPKRIKEEDDLLS